MNETAISEVTGKREPEPSVKVPLEDIVRLIRNEVPIDKIIF